MVIFIEKYGDDATGNEIDPCAKKKGGLLQWYLDWSFQFHVTSIK